MATIQNLNHTLSGRITDRQGKPLTGLTVRAYDQDPKSHDDFLGEAMTNEDGRYTIRFSEAQFKPGGKESGGPDVYIRVFFGEEQLAESPVRRNANKRVSISLRVQVPDMPESLETTFSVSGLVVQSDGRPWQVEELRGLVVRAFDQGLRERQATLGESKVADDGRYTINYNHNRLLDPKLGSANLVVEIVGRDGTVLTKSEIRFNASRGEIVNLAADPDAKKCEWRRLRRRLRPALMDLQMADLTDKDLDFVAKSHHLALEQLRPAVQAEQAAAVSGLPNWLHYALVRQGLPKELDALLETPPSRILEALDAAQQSNVIDPPDKKTLEQLAVRQAAHALAKPLPGHRLQAGILFELAGLNQQQQRGLATSLIGRDQNIDGTVDLPADSGLDDAARQRVGLTLTIATLTDDHEKTVRELLNDKSVASLRDLAKNYDLHDWQALIKVSTGSDGSDLPDDLSGDTPEKRREAYSRRLYNRATAAFPTIATAYGLSRRDAMKNNPAAKLLPTIVERDATFDLASTRLDAYVRKNSDALKIAEQEIVTVTEELKRVQRLYRLKPEMMAIARLLEDKEKLDSAHAILRTGKRQFVEKYGADDKLGAQTADAIYQAAENVAALTLGVFAHYSPAYNTSLAPAAIARCPMHLIGVPDYPTLFGSLDGCECEPCESVLSPAAYLTDILAFVERQVEENEWWLRSVPEISKTGLDALAVRSFCDASDRLIEEHTRRPDIVKTLLSCRNADTELPYVDLVVEILENAVAPRGPEEETLQTTLPADLLAAQPEHLNSPAYNQLASALFPFGLPFDLWHEEETIYLEQLGASRAELLQALYPFTAVPDSSVYHDQADPPHDLTEIRRWQDPEIIRSHLGLADSDWKLILGQPISSTAPLSTAEKWGYKPSSGWWRPLTNADNLLIHSGLDYGELLCLFELRSFNPDGAIGIAKDSSGKCTPKEITLKGINQGVLDYLYRFLRLSRALGWTMRELDQALLALSQPFGSKLKRPEINPSFLTRLAHIEHLRERFPLPLDEILSWWSPLDTREYRIAQLPHETSAPSLYERLFLAGRSDEPEHRVFQLNADRTNLRDTNRALVRHLPALAGALRLTRSDLALLIEDLIYEMPDNQLTLENISLLFRHMSLARALGLTVEEYLIVKRLIGFDPFPPARLVPSEPLINTLQTLRFVERVEAIKDSGFTIVELDYLLRQTMPFEQRAVAPTAEWTHESFDKLKASVLSLSVSLPHLALFYEMLQLSFPDLPSEETLDDLRRLIEQALGAIAAPTDAGSQDFAPIQQLLRDVQILIAPNGELDDATRIEVHKIIHEALQRYERTLRPLQLETLQTALAEILGLPADICRVLLENTPYPADPSRTAADALLRGMHAGAPRRAEAPLVELLYRLDKAALVITRLGIRAQELASKGGEARYLRMSATAGWLDLVSLPVRRSDTAGPFDAWMRTVRLFDLRNTLPAEQQENLFELFDVVADYLTSSQSPETQQKGRQAYVEKLATLTGWSIRDLVERAASQDGAIRQSILSQLLNPDTARHDSDMLQAVFPQHFADERLPRRILTIMQLLKRLGVTAAEARNWVVAPADGTEPGDRVQRIRNALKARYGEDWADVVKPMRDRLRERQRQALVTYLLHTWNLEHAGDLSDHFLIDVEMSPCMMTSRLIQAIASVQLFVQRVLMNLEPGLALSDQSAEQWDWMKNYRVWEANRKIFLYPENWIEPELRDDKTPFFKDLENELLQTDMSNEAAEAALLHYLEKLHEVARLQVCGATLDLSRGRFLIFARTRDVPHRYFYRQFKFIDNNWKALRGEFTPWEHVEVDIEGDHLIPVVYNGRVYLFWPIFTSEDEAPLTHTFQSLLSLFGQMFRLLDAIGDLVRSLVQGMGMVIIGGLTNSVIAILSSIEHSVNFIPGVDGFSLFDTRQTVRSIRTALLTTIGLDSSASNDNTSLMIERAGLGSLTDLETVFEEVGGLVSNYEQYLLSFLPAKRLEVQLAWSEFKGDSWTAKKTSAGVVSFRDVISAMFENIPQLPGLGRVGTRRLFSFSSNVDSDNRLDLRCHVALPTSLLTYQPSGEWLTEPKEIGHFRLESCGGELHAVDTDEEFGFVDLFTQATSQILTIADNALKGLQVDRQLQQRGVPVTPHDDPKRPSLRRALLDRADDPSHSIPKHFFPPYPVDPAKNQEDIYRVSVIDNYSSLLVYQDAKRVFLVDLARARSGTFRFLPFYHPYTCALLSEVQRAGVNGLYRDRYNWSDGRLTLSHP